MAQTRNEQAQHNDETEPLIDSTTSRAHREESPPLRLGVSMRHVGIATTLAVLLFLQGTNISGLTTIQGAVATDLNALSKASWLISTYVIAASSTQPLFGRLCRIFSPRICLFVSSMFFAVGIFISAIASSFEVFCSGRVISGIGGGGVSSCIIMLVLDIVSEQNRGLGLGSINTAYTIGVSLGAILYGALLELAGWRELFLVQAPIALVAGITALFIIPKSASTGDDSNTTVELLKRIDWLGVVTLTTSIVLFLVSLASTQVHITPLLLSLPFAACFLLVEYKVAADPIIPLSVFHSRGALLSCLATTFLMISRWAVLFYSPVYALAIREWPPSLAGTMLIPANLGFGIGGVLVGWLHIRSAGSYYMSCIIVLGSFSVSLFVLSQLATPTISAAAFMFAAFVNGLCTGAALNYTLVHALHLTLASHTFIITSLMATFRGFGASFGSAVGSGIFGRAFVSTYTALRNANNLPFDGDLLEQLLGSPGTVETLTGIDHDIALESYVAGLSNLFMVMGFIAIGAVALQAGTGWNGPAVIEREREREE